MCVIVVGLLKCILAKLSVKQEDRVKLTYDLSLQIYQNCYASIISSMQMSVIMYSIKKAWLYMHVVCSETSLERGMRSFYDHYVTLLL